MDTKHPLSFKDYLNYEFKDKTNDARKLEKKTPKNKMYGGSNTFSAKEKENNREGVYESKETGHRTNIEEDTIKNNNFRKVLFTTPRTQLVLMSLLPGEEIGEETHKGDQFFRFEQGKGKMVIDGKSSDLKDGSSVVVPEGARHNVINTGDEPLKLYALYSPPQHKDGAVDKTKPEKE